MHASKASVQRANRIHDRQVRGERDIEQFIVQVTFIVSGVGCADKEQT
jgi:hypothetical protein